jgi:hypothetical protein
MLCILRTFTMYYYILFSVLFCNGCSNRWNVSSNIYEYVFNTQLHVIKKMKENEYVNIKWYLDDLKTNNWFSALLLNSYVSVIHVISLQQHWLIVLLSNSEPGCWFRFGFALDPLLVRSGSALANHERTQQVHCGSALGSLSARLGSVGTVISTKGERRLWLVSRGCLLLLGTWFYLRICWGFVLPYTPFRICFLDYDYVLTYH